MDLDLDYIETLEAVVESGSFAGAARRLGRVQSAVSYNIRQLETRLGVKLFDRRGHKAVLTSVGTTILEEGRILLERARRIESLARQFREGWEPRLRIVIDGSLPLEPIMAALKSLADEGVLTRIEIKVEFLGGVQYRFENEKAHMMLVKDFRPSEKLVSRPFSDVTCVLVSAADHALAQQSDAQTLSLLDLHQHVELSVHDSSESGMPDPHLFGGARMFYLSDFYTKKNAVLMGLGFGWMPLYLIEEELRLGELRELPYEGGSRFQFRSWLVYPVNRPLGRTGRMLVDLLEQQLSGVGGIS